MRCACEGLDILEGSNFRAPPPAAGRGKSQPKNHNGFFYNGEHLNGNNTVDTSIMGKPLWENREREGKLGMDFSTVWKYQWGSQDGFLYIAGEALVGTSEWISQ